MPEDVKTVVNWEAVRMLALTVGVREAARRMGISEEATMKRSQREGWLSAPEAKQAHAMALQHRTGITVSPQMSASAILAAEMKALNEKTRIGHARAAAKVAEHIQELPAHELLEKAQDVKATAQHADLVHGWKESGPASVKLRLDVVGSAQEPVIDVQADIVTPSDSYASDDLDDY